MITNVNFTLRGYKLWRCGLLMLILLWAMAANAEASRYAFGVNGLDFSLSRYSVSSSGELRHLGHIPMVKSLPFVLLDPSGRFVLVPSKTVATMSVFRINALNGDLSEVPGSPFKTGLNSPFALAFHPSGRFLYVAARFTGVGAYTFDVETGALKPLAGSPYRAERRTRSVFVHPSGQFLYASNAYSNSVSAYRIDAATGALTELADSPYSAGKMENIDYKLFGMDDVPEGAGGIPYAVTVDPQGRFAFVANWAAASVSVFRIDAKTGQLSAVKGSPFFTGFNPYRLTVHPNGNFLYVAQLSGDDITVHAIDDKTGRLTAVPGSPFITGGEEPVAINFNVAGTQAYVPNYETNDISLFDIDVVSGAMQLREIVKTRSGPWYLAITDDVGSTVKKETPVLLLAQGAAGLLQITMSTKQTRASAEVSQSSDALKVVDLPGGRFVYALNRAKGEVSTFRLKTETGQLSALAGGVIATGKQPGQMAVDTNGWYLYVTNSGDNSMIVYYLDPQTGLPRRAHKTPFIPAGKRPTSVVLDTTARYAFVINADDNNVSVYSYMNSVTPLIFESRGAGSPFPTGKQPVALTVEPRGRFAYVANAGDNTISAFYIHHQTGALTELPGSPFVTDHQPRTVLAHPNGKWLYFLSADSRDVGLYAIESELGALAKRRVAVTLPVKAKSMWLNAAGDVAYLLSENGLRLLQYRLDAKDGRLTLLTEKHFSNAVSDLQIIE